MLLKVHEKELLACNEFEDGFLLLQRTTPRSVESLDCDSLMKAAFGKTDFFKKFKMEQLAELRRAHRAEDGLGRTQPAGRPRHSQRGTEFPATDKAVTYIDREHG